MYYENLYYPIMSCMIYSYPIANEIHRGMVSKVRNIKYMKSMYPDITKKIQRCVDEVCNKMNYQYSIINEKYVSKETIEKIGAEVYQLMKLENNNLYSNEYSQVSEQNLLKSLIDTSVINEILIRKDFDIDEGIVAAVASPYNATRRSPVFVPGGRMRRIDHEGKPEEPEDEGVVEPVPTTGSFTPGYPTGGGYTPGIPRRGQPYPQPYQR